MNLLDQIVNGLALGAGYALLAVGWTVLLGAARVVNFAHGQLYMLGAFITWASITAFGIPYLAAIPIALVGVALLGVVLQTALTRITLEQNIVSLMLVTLAFGYLIEGLSALIFGGNPRIIPSPFKGENLALGSARFTQQDALIIVAAIGLYAATYYVLQRTTAGRIVRGVAEDPKLAQLYGINAAKVYHGVFAFAAVSAALAGAVIAPRAPILTSIGFNEVIITFLVVVLGGIGNVIGGFIVGFGLGIFVAVFGGYFSPSYSLGAVFAVLLVILAVRPEGLKVQ